ncbi:hypothetical protein LWI28_015318 [Acer negundo]|uniref:Uncharacterized protein n=1 Tax=Acer negundo TaxID=4023 RepID=A0AAD5JLR4_ACENE|nr:hypothetical protein LWI28_015318 [Acer negundo]
MGNDFGELSKYDKVKESCHSFSKKKSLGVSKCSSKLSCKNKSILVNGDIVDGMGLFLNSNFLKRDRAILKSEGGSEFGNQSRGVEKVLLLNKDIKKMPLSSGLITIPVKWENNDDAIKYSKRRNGRDYCLVVKGYGMKLRSSKNCLNLSWNLEKEISRL